MTSKAKAWEKHKKKMKKLYSFQNTKNKSNKGSKTRRKMAAHSRKINRR